MLHSFAMLNLKLSIKLLLGRNSAANSSMPHTRDIGTPIIKEVNLLLPE